MSDDELRGLYESCLLADIIARRIANVILALVSK